MLFLFRIMNWGSSVKDLRTREEGQGPPLQTHADGGRVRGGKGSKDFGRLRRGKGSKILQILRTSFKDSPLT